MTRPNKSEEGLLARPWVTGSLAALLLAASLVLGWQWELRENATQIRQVSGQARILAGSLAGALAFDDEDTAREYVAALRRDPSIRAAAVFGDDGRRIIGITRGEETLPDRISPRSPVVRGGTLTIVEPVREGSLELGYVYLKTSIEPVAERLSRYAAIGIIVTLAALLIAILGRANAAAARANRKLQEEVTAREQAERALRQVQKMEALGQLTGGVAHDFNNLLMVASSGLDLLDKAKTGERREMLKSAIRDALDRGARITEQLLSFSRRRPVKSEIIQLQDHIGNLANLLDHSLREDITVEFKIDDELWPIDVDVSQFDIAILNLAVNARDAMPRGGKLCLAAGNCPGAPDRDDAVEISVHDEGTGMAQEALDRAFEPFFTTKGVGKGTGLGLSQVYGFVRGAGGTVGVESELGKGTKVVLTFPRCAARGPKAAEPITFENTATSGSKVLLVEDDPHLNELITEMLLEHGVIVERATSAAEAVRMLDSADIQAIISDMVMPGELNGLDLVREARAKRPDVAVVLMTGYSDAAGSAELEGYPLLRKPFSAAQLHAALGAARNRLADK